jgi:hypothetical protein
MEPVLGKTESTLMADAVRAASSSSSSGSGSISEQVARGRGAVIVVIHKLVLL